MSLQKPQNVRNNAELRYRISPTLLDSFHTYIYSDNVWEKYFGNSTNPKVSREDFRFNSYQELINAINRVELEYSRPADIGTAFNEAIDVYIGGLSHANKCTFQFDSDNLQLSARLKGKEDVYIFPATMLETVGQYMADAIPQYRVFGTMQTRFGGVLLSGYTDYVKPFSVVDLKTTNRYETGKYRDNNQHRVYLYCLNQNGVQINNFEYYVVELYVSKRSGLVTRWEIFTEQYQYDEKIDKPRLREDLERFIEFIEAHRSEITCNHIFDTTTL